MFGQLKDVQEKVKVLRQQIVQLRATGEAGAGIVKATVNGDKKVLSIVIDETLMNPNERIMLQDLVVAATNIAIEDVNQQIKEIMRENASDMLPHLPIDLDLIL